MLLTASGTLESIVQFISALLIFLFVLLITWFTTRYIANYQKGKMAASDIEILETSKIAQNKYVQILRVGEKYLVVAVSKETVTMLTEISPQELKYSMNQPVEQPDFSTILKKAKELTGRKNIKKQADTDEEKNV